VAGHHAATIGAMTDRTRLIDRWPSALAVVCAAGAIAVIALLDHEELIFGPSIATMAGIYLLAYAIGRPWTAWPGFVVLSVIVSVLQALWRLDVIAVDPAAGMVIVLVLLWLWTVARRRFTEKGTFTVQTGGMIGFGLLTLVCAAVQPTLGVVLAGVGWLAHGVWDAYHFKVGQVVNRSWSEFCGVVDLAVGTALIVAAVV
jgi:hypothetical protein